MKRREFFKTVILTLLVISSVILASKIWFTEELWSDDYNSFSYKPTFFSKLFSFFGKEAAVSSLDYNQIFFPKQIMLSKGENSVLIKPTDNSYNEFSEDIKLLLSDMFKDFTLNSSTEEEFKKACRSASIFVDFYNYTSLNMLGDYFDAPENSQTDNINEVRQLLISVDEPFVFLRNSSDKKVYRIDFKTDITQISEKIENMLNKSKNVGKLYTFAFENSFDVPSSDPNAQSRLLLEPYIIINIAGGTLPHTETQVLSGDEGKFNELLSCFNMSTSTSRSFTDTEGTVNFVENYSTLKLGNDGKLEYNCVNASKGIYLGDGITSDYNLIKKAGEFLENINALYPLPDGNQYVFNRISENNGKYEIHFDITYNGIPVLLNPEDGNTPVSNAVIEIENSRIIGYSQFFIALRSTGKKTEVKFMINALDEFYSTYDTSNNPGLVITDMYNTYYYTPSNGTTETKWVVALSNSDHVILEGKGGI